MNWGHCLPSCLLLSLASVGIAAVILSILAKTGHRIPAPRYCLPTANSHAKQWVQVWGGAHRSPRLRISLYPNCCTFSARHPVLLPPFGLYSFLQDSHASSTSQIRQSSYCPIFHQALVEILGEWDIRRTLCGLARTLKPVCWRRPKRRPGGPRNKEGGGWEDGCSTTHQWCSPGNGVAPSQEEKGACYIFAAYEFFSDLLNEPFNAIGGGDEEHFLAHLPLRSCTWWQHQRIVHDCRKWYVQSP